MYEFRAEISILIVRLCGNQRQTVDDLFEYSKFHKTLKHIVKTAKESSFHKIMCVLAGDGIVGIKLSKEVPKTQTCYSWDWGHLKL